jgi:murein DD-endopeptidase MepM/ murein hydrolase activator NlpD
VPHRPLRLALVAATAVAVAAGALVVAPRSQAQVPPLGGTTTTAPPPTTEPPGPDFTEGADEAPEGAEDTEGDGAPAPVGGVRVPAEAQRVIDSVARTGSSDNSALLAQLTELQELGLSEEESLRVGLGRFPIAGPARYSHDWLFPRYGPGFRFHLGTDVFAAQGTPIRAPVDGVARSANGGLGGLTVKVVMPDGTYFYLAHLSGLAPGFVDGMAVQTGDIVGYVGDSGNARGGAPHLHIGIYPGGGAPIDPKPVLDGFLAEAAERLPSVVAAYQEARAAQPAPAAPRTVSEEERLLRPMLATEVLHPLAGGGSGLAPEILYLAGSHPVTGPRVLLELAVDELVAGIDWNVRADPG